MCNLIKETYLETIIKIWETNFFTCHIQDEALYNGRMLEENLLLVCSLHWFGTFTQKGASKKTKQNKIINFNGYTDFISFSAAVINMLLSLKFQHCNNSSLWRFQANEFFHCNFSYKHFNCKSQAEIHYVNIKKQSCIGKDYLNIG